MKTRIAELREQEVDLEARFSSAPSTTVTPHPNLAKLYARKVAELTASLNDPAIKTEAGEVLRTLIDRIVLTPRADEPGLDAELHGNLAQILALSDAGAQIHEHPAAVAVGCQLSVVAGAGYQRCLYFHQARL